MTTEKSNKQNSSSVKVVEFVDIGKEFADIVAQKNTKEILDSWNSKQKQLKTQ